MSVVLEALRKRFKSPQEAIAAFGLDAAPRDNKEPTMNTRTTLRMVRRLAQDAAEVEKELEKEEGEDRRRDADDRRARDDDPNTGIPIREKDNEENMAVGEDAAADWAEMEEDRKARDKRADDARKRLGRDETEEEREDREKEESAEDARKHLGRDESEEERKEREDCEGEDRKARDAFRRAHDARRHADDAMRRAHDGYRKARDRRRAMDVKHRLGRDESEEERMEREKKEGEDRKARGMDRRHADDRHRADDRRHADDEPPDFKGKPKTGAMDAAAVRRTVEAAIAADRERQAGVREAEYFVRPWIGNVQPMAFDSEEDVYLDALKALNVDIKGVPSGAYRKILEMTPKPGSRPERSNGIAMDASATSELHQLVPSLARIKVIG
jgi:hypothetical protein